MAGVMLAVAATTSSRSGSSSPSNCQFTVARMNASSARRWPWLSRFASLGGIQASSSPVPTLAADRRSTRLVPGSTDAKACSTASLGVRGCRPDR